MARFLERAGLVGAVIFLVASQASPETLGKSLLIDDSLTADEEAILNRFREAPELYPEAQITPAQQAIESLGRLQNEIRKGARQHKDGFLQASPQALVLCQPTILSLCLNGRFRVIGVWDSPYDAAGAFATGAIQLTPQSGILFFQDPTNFEVVIKVLNSNCLASPPRPWVFIAGLTNFGVAIEVTDLLTGVSRVYRNPLQTVMGPTQDQDTPFLCF